MTWSGVLLAIIGIASPGGAAAEKELFPIRLPALVGWHGISLAKSDFCPDCRRLVFPAQFGASHSSELELLRTLADSNPPVTIEGSIEGVARPNHDALDQLKRLATERQVPAAAAIILRADSPGGIDRGGGEGSEFHGEEYVVPILLGFRRLREVVTRDLEDHVAERVWIAVFNPSSDRDLNCEQIARTVEQRGAARLAKKIRRRCAHPP
jgi:hypothetical protein